MTGLSSLSLSQLGTAGGDITHDAKAAFDQVFPPGPLPPLWHNTTSVQTAMSQNTLGVGYSGSGLLLFYFIGVSKVLQQLGVIKPGETRVAGTSGGIIGCAPDFGICSHEKFLTVGKEFVTRCRARNNCAGTLDAEVSRVLDQILPNDAANIVNGTAYILYAHPDENGVPTGNWTNTYESRDDLAQAIRTGVYLPMWSAPSMTRPFRGIRAYDGGFRRALPCPPDVTFCVTASVLPPLNFRELMNSLSEPHTVRVLRRALSSTLGASPMQFMGNVIMKNRPENYKLDEVVLGTVAYLSAVNPGPDVHIYPGKYNKNPYSIWEWILMMIIPPTPAEIDNIVQMGAEDAAAWAREHGLMPPLDGAAASKASGSSAGKGAAILGLGESGDENLGEYTLPFSPADAAAAVTTAGDADGDTFKASLARWVGGQDLKAAAAAAAASPLPAPVAAGTGAPAPAAGDAAPTDTPARKLRLLYG